MDIILFVLPAHTSNILQLLDVAVFGPFKNYYYSACSTCMAENIGQIITRYDICQIACKAYTRAMSPANIQSSFRKTAIFPHNPSVSYMHQMVPCESFRVENPVQRVTLLNTGRAEAEAYILKKEENITNNALSTKVPPKTETKPNAGGRAITDDDYVNEMDDYIQNSQTQQLQPTPAIPKVPKKPANLPNKRTCLNHLPAASMSFI